MLHFESLKTLLRSLTCDPCQFCIVSELSDISANVITYVSVNRWSAIHSYASLNT